MTDTTMVLSGLAALLSDLVAGQLAGATIQPFTNDVDPGDGAVLTDFTLATFNGSAAKPIGTYVGPYRTAGGKEEVLAPQLVFTTDAVIPETVYGFVLKSVGAGTPFLGYMRRDVPKLMAASTDVLAVVPRFQMPATGFGAFVETED